MTRFVLSANFNDVSEMLTWDDSNMVNKNERIFLPGWLANSWNRGLLTTAIFVQTFFAKIQWEMQQTFQNGFVSAVIVLTAGVAKLQLCAELTWGISTPGLLRATILAVFQQYQIGRGGLAGEYQLSRIHNTGRRPHSAIALDLAWYRRIVIRRCRPILVNVIQGKLFLHTALKPSVEGNKKP